MYDTTIQHWMAISQTYEKLGLCHAAGISTPHLYAIANGTRRAKPVVAEKMVRFSEEIHHLSGGRLPILQYNDLVREENRI